MARLLQQYPLLEWPRALRLGDRRIRAAVRYTGFGWPRFANEATSRQNQQLYRRFCADFETSKQEPPMTAEHMLPFLSASRLSTH